MDVLIVHAAILRLMMIGQYSHPMTQWGDVGDRFPDRLARSLLLRPVSS
jgi:hypothetical protein